MYVAVIFHEKYGDNIFVAKNNQEFAQIFYDILKERFEDDYWYDHDILKEDSEEGDLFKSPKKSTYDKIVSALENKNYSACYSILNSRSDCGYESFTIERISDVVAIDQNEAQIERFEKFLGSRYFR